jgi:hypothetical protein
MAKGGFNKGKGSFCKGFGKGGHAGKSNATVPADAKKPVVDYQALIWRDGGLQLELPDEEWLQWVADHRALVEKAVTQLGLADWNNALPAHTGASLVELL